MNITNLVGKENRRLWTGQKRTPEMAGGESAWEGRGVGGSGKQGGGVPEPVDWAPPQPCDGAWKMTNSPEHGEDPTLLKLTTQAGNLMGEISSPRLGTHQITRVIVSGRTLNWTIGLTNPAVLKLEMTVDRNGDRLSRHRGPDRMNFHRSAEPAVTVCLADMPSTNSAEAVAEEAVAEESSPLRLTLSVIWDIPNPPGFGPSRSQ